MPRYKLTIAYDGTDFCGWQKQEPPAGAPIDAHKLLSAEATDAPAAAGAGRLILRTVQEVVERAVREVVREPVQLHGASRTDSGVHARGQVAAFTCGARDAATTEPGGERPGRTGWPRERGTDTLVRAINSRLPEDVLVVGADEVAEHFNPISDAVAKAYSYALLVSPHRALWDRRYVHHLWVPLDLAAMNAAAARLVGEHDFAAFAAAGHGRLSTVRRVFDCKVVDASDASPAMSPLGGMPAAPSGHGPDWQRRLRIDISGNGFLWNMVRIIAGTLVEVGRGKLTPDDVTAALTSQDRRRAGPTLPARGLFLEWVRYDTPGVPETAPA